jgi:16S rRNA (adenine1518-N6/adenine1519-N6)-dimethyltransferase
VAAPANTRRRSTGRPAKKAGLGQNFLTDLGAAQRIVDALGDITHSTVVEIGPGRGVITGLLAAKAEKLIAIELDRTLAAQLRMAYLRSPHVEIIEADVLRVDCDSLVQGRAKQITTAPQAMPHKVARVVGNLPYYITSDILLHLLECHKNFDRIVIMVQKEVADRIAASPGSSDYGLLSATAQLFTDVENLFTLPPEAFSPPPKVHSSVVRLRVTPKAAQLGVEPQRFMGFLKLAFAQKRKTLVNNLKSHFNAELIRASMREAALSPDVRAEAVELAQMATLHRVLSKEN